MSYFRLNHVNFSGFKNHIGRVFCKMLTTYLSSVVTVRYMVYCLSLSVVLSFSRVVSNVSYWTALHRVFINICRMLLLVPALDTCFWHNTPHIIMHWNGIWDYGNAKTVVYWKKQFFKEWWPKKYIYTYSDGIYEKYKKQLQQVRQHIVYMKWWTFGCFVYINNIRESQQQKGRHIDSFIVTGCQRHQWRRSQ